MERVQGHSSGIAWRCASYHGPAQQFVERTAALPLQGMRAAAEKSWIGEYSLPAPPPPLNSNGGQTQDRDVFLTRTGLFRGGNG
jgi:hypothetical protein